MTSDGGMLVTIEGIDGTGKTTLKESLTSPDVGTTPENLYKTQEPTEGPIGELLRSHLSKGTFATEAELHLFIADHANHLQQIKAELEKGKIVICDRYIDSRCAYQAPGIEDQYDNPLGHIYGLHQPWTIEPDLTILLDADPKVAVDRLDTDDKFEREETLSRIRENYLELKKRHERIKMIDTCELPEKGVKVAAANRIKKRVTDTL